MSKSASAIFLPAFGGVALALGLGYGLANRNYAEDKLSALEDRLGQVEAQAQAAGGAAASAKAALSEAREAASAATKKATGLASQVAELQKAVLVAEASGGTSTAAAPKAEGGYGLGRAALPEEIAAWDVDVLPDGRGLPEGEGDVWTGEELFVEQCGACHGDFAEGVDNWPVLAGGFDTLADEDPVKTVGSYWPYLSTVWDYVHRSMPFGAAGTLSADETYAIVAYILYSNDLVDDDFVLSRETFAEVEMHNRAGFVVDDRPALEYTPWRTEPCMENCKEEVEVTMRSVFLVETPAEGGTNSVMNHASTENLPSFSATGPAFIPAAAKPAETAEAPPEAEVQAAAEASDLGDLVTEGEKVFKKCKSCHQIGAGAKNRSGPQLTGIMGRTIGSVEGFKYSKGFQEAAAEGMVWDEASMAAFLAKPKEYMPGTRMSFAGLKKEAEVASLIAYLSSVAP